MWTRVWTAALGVALVAAGGCSECDAGATRCSGNIVEHCGHSDPEMGGDWNENRWRSGDICSSPQTCITPPGIGAMCAIGTDPDPLCGDAFSYCDGNTFVGCASGYRVTQQPCPVVPNDPVSSKCVDAFPGQAVCVPPEAMPNDLCAPAGTSDAAAPARMCVDALDISCLAGLAVATTACAVCDPQCRGFLGDVCGSDADCATGFTCPPVPSGPFHCTAACDPTDPNAVQHCEDLYTANGPPPSSSSSTRPYNSRMTCTAGFCAWMDCGTTPCP